MVGKTLSNRRRQWKRRYGHLGRKTGKLASVGSSVRSLLTTSTPENLPKEFHQHDQSHRPSFYKMDEMKPTRWNSRDKCREWYALKARIKCNKKNNTGFKRPCLGTGVWKYSNETRPSKRIAFSTHRMLYDNSSDARRRIFPNPVAKSRTFSQAPITMETPRWFCYPFSEFLSSM